MRWGKQTNHHESREVNEKTLLCLLLVLCSCFAVAAAEEDSLWEMFQQQPERLEGHAYVELIPMMEPVKLTCAQYGSEDVYWTLDFWLCETNNVGFTIEEERMVFFDQNLTPVRDITGGADELFHFYTNQINPGDFMLFNDAYPKDERLAYIGMMITGTDANGHKLSFPMLYELSQEFTTSYTAEELAQQTTSVTLPDERGRTTWPFALLLREEAGVGVQVEQIRVVPIFADGTHQRVDYSRDELASRCQSSHIDRYGVMLLFIELATEKDKELTGVGFHIFITNDKNQQIECRYYASADEL